ncbi:unnamed protein product [Paramecium primaurelia]|uniref:CNNM transmembrane domain-containing protein n=1 Tax=Paramecium primaurelia TaxID=5886 RepID=A0A8S1L243_PARPR|nr:unnamed protein product [Paramecium primaurelia]
MKYLHLFKLVVFLHSSCLVLGDEIENKDEPHHHRYSPSEGIFWLFLLYAFGLSILAAFCSGNTQGLLSIDMLNLELKLKSGTEYEKKVAQILLPVISQHHLLLSTLLVGNAFACETLPIILHQLAPDWLAILISAGIIVLFGEIIPSAFTTGPDQLVIGMKMIPYVKILQAILYIICYPLSLLLDYILGVHLHQRYKIKDIRGLLNLHAQDSGHGNNAQLARDQMQLMDSMMEMRKQTVMKNCKDIKKVFMLNADERYSSDLKNKIRIKGFSKIPVYQGSNKDQIIGTIQAKSILKLTAQDYGRSISSLLQMQEPLIIPKDTTMLEMLILFQHERKSLAFICDKGKKVQEYDTLNISNLIVEGQYNIIALIGLTDVFEEMLDFEIEDEDVHGTLCDYPKQKNKYTELKVITEEQEKQGRGRELKQKLLS